MALPPLTRQASSTSQLQTTPIFSLMASTTALNFSKRPISLPARGFLCWSAPFPQTERIPHNAVFWITLAFDIVHEGPRGASSRSTRRYCLGRRQFRPAVGAKRLERPEGALVGHLARVGDPVAEIDIGQATASGGIGQPQDHVGAQSAARVLRIEVGIDRRDAARQPVDQAGADQPPVSRI